MPSIPWPTWPRDDKKTSTKNSGGVLENLKAQFEVLPPTIQVLTIFGLGSVTTLSTFFLYKRYGRRIRNTDWITPKLLEKKSWLKGVVTRWVHLLVIEEW